MPLRGSSPTRSSKDMAGLLPSADLVEKFVRRIADTRESTGLDHRHIRIGDVPEVRRDLVARDEVFDLRATNPWPTFDIAELKVEDVGDLRREILDVRIPVEIVGSAEQKLGVVVQDHEAHVVDGANPIHHFIANAAVKNLQKRAQPFPSEMLRENFAASLPSRPAPPDPDN